jgi:hypothetical protein
MIRHGKILSRGIVAVSGVAVAGRGGSIVVC